MQPDEVGEFRRVVGPLIDGVRATQRHVAERVTALGGNKVDQSKVSRWLKEGNEGPRDMQTKNALRLLTLEVATGAWPPATQEKEPGNGDGHRESLDEWGLARTRVVERMVSLLEGDRRTFELLAEARANLSRAALLEAEKAPDYRRAPPISEAQILGWMTQALEMARLGSPPPVQEKNGDGSRIQDRQDGHEQPGSPPQE